MNPNGPPPGVGRRWVKGQSGNPRGDKRSHPEVLKLKALTRDEMTVTGAKIVKATPQKLVEIAKDPNSTVLEVWMATIAIQSIKKGESRSLDILLNHFLGKPKERIEHEGLPTPQVVVMLPSNGREIKSTEKTKGE